MKQSERKALKYYKEDKVFKLTKDISYELYGVEGKTGVHEVRYNADRMEYRCSCNNIRLTECSHILAIKLYKLESS